MLAKELLRQILMKEAVKKSAGSSGIMTINKNIAADVDKLLQKYINDAMQQGVDIETLSPDQLKMIVAMNQPKTPRVIPGTSAEGKAITEKLFGKKGEVVDFPQPRTFKQEIELP
jgi:ribosomal protein L22